MKPAFYREVAELCRDARAALMEHETTAKIDGIMTRIRSPGAVLLEKGSLMSDVRKDIPLKDQLQIQQDANRLLDCNTLKGGRGSNSSLEATIVRIESVCTSLAVKFSKTESKNLFYSWQSALPNSSNRNFIKKCLEVAIRDSNRSLLLEERIALDSDTAGVPGSPDIVHAIMRKIDISSAFVADVSFVNGKIPNPNVMLELGYAIKSLGDNRIIMVFNEAYGSTRDLPFDLGFKRQLIYHCDEATPDKGAARELLSGKLKAAICAIFQSLEET